MAYPNSCQHRFTNPAEAKALPDDGASVLVSAQGVPLRHKVQQVTRRIASCLVLQQSNGVLA